MVKFASVKGNRPAQLFSNETDPPGRPSETFPQSVSSPGNRAGGAAPAGEGVVKGPARRGRTAPARLLDHGCGWGSLPGFAAERCGVQAAGVTVSVEEARLARERCAGLPVAARARDHLALGERFGPVVSVGRFEHAG